MQYREKVYVLVEWRKMRGQIISVFGQVGSKTCFTASSMYVFQFVEPSEASNLRLRCQSGNM